MEITNANAGILLPYITTQLRDCAFVAVDLEFTGIDRDALDPGASTPEEIAQLLVREPADMYPKKLEVLKPYSIIQIGFSIFTRPTSSSSEGTTPSSVAAGPQSTSHPTVQELASHVAEFVRDINTEDYYVHTLKAAVRTYEAAAEKAGSDGRSSGWEAAKRSVVEEASRMENNASSSNHTTAAARPYACDNGVELLRRFRFLDALYRTITQLSREDEQLKLSAAKPGTDASPPPPVPAADSYRVQTFSAYMFPSAQTIEQNVGLNIDTATFLVNNHIDLTRWVRDGLRFKPLKSAAAALAGGAATRFQLMEQQSNPHTAVPHFTEVFKTKLDALLPLSAEELNVVKFVLHLHEAAPNADSARVNGFYVGATRAFIQFSRGQIPESELPSPIFVTPAIHRDEVTALATIGVAKVNRKYLAAPNFRGSGGNDGASSGDGALAAAVGFQGYGTALLEMLVHATGVLQKPIVFYNGYTDLMFLLLSLYGAAEMPPSLQEFKTVVHQHFPEVYDTRVLACAGPLQELGNFTGKLASVVAEISKVPKIASNVSFIFDGLAVGGQDPSGFSTAHDAGFDAMLAGKLFAYTAYGIRLADMDHTLYLNYLASYGTLLSINLTEEDDGVLQEVKTAVYYLADSFGLRTDATREKLHGAGLTALVLFRGSGCTIQPVGRGCQEPYYQKRAEEVLSHGASSPVKLLRIDI